jgi:hypothetical protein
MEDGMEDGMEDAMESETAAAPGSSSAALAPFVSTFSAFADSAKSCCACCCSGAACSCRWALALSFLRSLLPAEAELASQAPSPASRAPSPVTLEA